MGVPALFRWLSQKYPKIISQVIEEKPGEVDGQEIPISMAGPNPNGEECDNLYMQFWYLWESKSNDANWYEGILT